MFRHCRAQRPEDLTADGLIAWTTAARANNTIRQRMSTARTFVRWAQRRGLMTHDPTVDLDDLRKSYPRLYGKVESQHPARWLTYDEAFVTLIGACRDGTWTGSRDQLVIRLGLMGARASEIANMRWGDLQPDGRLIWRGKGRRLRTVTPGPTFLDLLARWRRAYEAGIGRPVESTDPLLVTNDNWRRMRWGTKLGNHAVFDIVTRRAQLAGLGHVAPHDLRRSAAGILHDTRTADGGHVYDLLDIQKVLDHADPATTQRSYISPRSDAVKKSAGLALD